jgi:hypothetical protein
MPRAPSARSPSSSWSATTGWSGPTHVGSWRRCWDRPGTPPTSFVEPVNGLFERSADEAVRLVDRFRRPSLLNISFAATEPRALARIFEGFDTAGGARVEFGAGFHNEETTPDGQSLRWAEPRATLHLAGVRAMTLKLGTMAVVPLPECRVLADGVLRAEVPGGGYEPITVHLADLGGVAEIRIDGDSCFSPAWAGEADDRLLSFTVSVLGVG